MASNQHQYMTLPDPDPGLMEDLSRMVGKNNVSAGRLDRICWSRDIWPRGYLWLREGKLPCTPDAVAWPGSEDEVADLVKWCFENKVSVIPASGGSGVCGGTLPLKGGIVMDLKRLNKVIELNSINHTVEAQAGINGEILERELNRKRFSLGHFPASMYCSTLGGWLAARSAGQLSSKYGKIEDMVINLSGVLPNGTPFKSSLSPRSAAGPDLDQLIIGSEGTLAVITRAVMAVHPAPGWSRFNGYLFKDMESGVEAIRLVMREGLDPAVVRLYDELDTKLHEKSYGVPGTGCLCIVGFEGEDNALIRAKAQKGFDICTERGRDLGQGPGQAWFAKRYSVSYMQSKVLSAGNTILDTCEVAAKWSSIMDLYLGMKGAIEPLAMVTAHISHVYPTGAAIYFTFVSGSEDPPASEVYERAWAAAMDACIRAGGTISHHHGIGAHKSRWMRQELGSGLDLYRRLKQRLDPDNLLNPGKMGLNDQLSEGIK